MQDVNKGKSLGRWGVREYMQTVKTFSAQPCCKSNTSLKNKIYELKILLAFMLNHLHKVLSLHLRLTLSTKPTV